MNFFDAQDRARRSTRRLVIVYILATLLIVAAVTALVALGLYTTGTTRTIDPSILLTTAVLATLLIVGATLYKTAVLSAGGSRVATEMGGTPVSPDVNDPLRRRLRNVVEEMSIASGVPVPDIYVLEAEQGINAFAAGYTPGDAAIAVTRGALETLDRDELQGVIAHEFSHILNGDMRLNIRMMGVLFGIMVLGLIGRVVLRGSFHGRALSGRRRRGAPAVLAIGLGLVILGWIGVLAARMIKAAISRKRESLADASAVQFTRQTEGLAGALKKIGGYEAKSYIQAVDPEEVSHMLFSFGSRGMAKLFSTHPPLAERIRALDPTFREEDFARVPVAEQRPAHEATGPAAHAFAAAPPTADAIAGSMGQPDAAQVELARGLRAGVPEDLIDAAHSPGQAFLLALALALDRSGRHLPRQLDILKQQLGPERSASIERYHARLGELGPRYHLPVLELAFPALKRRPPEQLEFLLDLARRMIETDGVIALYEYCFYRVLAGSLQQAADPSRFGRGNRVGRQAARDAAVKLVRIVAEQGSDEDAAREQAFRAGLSAFGRWVSSSPAAPDVSSTIAELDACLDVLQRINSSGRETLVRAVAATILHDGTLDVREAELLRAICAALDCPLPPIITAGE
ncbi:MAG TPA: M48 family metallopeptidase [Woeseiaceae bacterium]|nr:M48 family metallopeptidase [Woeseiaceae bacterium]